MRLQRIFSKHCKLLLHMCYRRYHRCNKHLQRIGCSKNHCRFEQYCWW